MLVYASCFVVVLQEQRSRSSTPSVHFSFFIFPIHPFYHFTNIRFAGIIIADTKFEFGIEPDMVGASVYDAFQVLFEAMKNVGTVIVCVVLVGIFIWMFDFVAQAGISGLINWIG